MSVVPPRRAWPRPARPPAIMINVLAICPCSVQSMNEGKARGCHVYTFTIAIISTDVHSRLHCWLPDLPHKNGRLLRGARSTQRKRLAAYFLTFLLHFSFSFSNTAKNSDAMLRMARPMLA